MDVLRLRDGLTTALEFSHASKTLLVGGGSAKLHHQGLAITIGVALDNPRFQLTHQLVHVFGAEAERSEQFPQIVSCNSTSAFIRVLPRRRGGRGGRGRGRVRGYDGVGYGS